MGHLRQQSQSEVLRHHQSRPQTMGQGYCLLEPSLYRHGPRSRHVNRRRALMGAIREAFNRVLSFFHKQQRDSDLDAELQSHIDLAVEENISHGMPPDEARRRALVRFGGVQQAKEQQREARSLPWLDILMQDLRYTARTLG